MNVAHSTSREFRRQAARLLYGLAHPSNRPRAGFNPGRQARAPALPGALCAGSAVANAAAHIMSI